MGFRVDAGGGTLPTQHRPDIGLFRASLFYVPGPWLPPAGGIRLTIQAPMALETLLSCGTPDILDRCAV